MSILFTPFKTGSLELKNRIVRSATVENRADEKGYATKELREFFVELARGDAGLIITSGAYVTRNGRSLKHLLGIYDDDLIPSYRDVTEAVHASGGRIAMQLYHAGRQTNPKLIGQTPVSASDVPDTMTRIKPRAMTGAEIEQLIQAFAEGARRAKEAGFDAVQPMAGHGYLINQFLSSRTNRRVDEWGGPLENRARFLLRIIDSVRKAVGPDFPVLVKINSEDQLKGGFTLDESEKVCSWLSEAGVDAVEVTGGTFESALNIARGQIPEDVILRQFKGLRRLQIKLIIRAMKKRFAFRQAYFLENAKKIRPKIKIPLILVGGLRDPEMMEKILEQGHADLLSMSRPLVREPDLPNRWKAGDRRPAECISCNRCFVEIVFDKPVRCFIRFPERER
jgi:2,4-dienoyl-CoA reductase-like NADH-dependent reductase (Old Yellow Enzyme family)